LPPTEAVFVRKTGGPERLSVERTELPPPGPGELRVRVAAAGVNFIDVYFRTGLYPRPLPYVAGLEGAGTIEALGPGVAGFSVGERVAWASAPGSYASHANVPAQVAVRVPEGVPDETAAAAMLQGMTAHYLAHGVRETRTGDTALVHAAAGGTGLLLVQTLRAAGARVIGTCSTPEKEALAREAGAGDVIRYDQTDFASVARELTGGLGVDVVYDSVGQATFEGSLRALRPRGLLALFGQASGPVPPFELRRLSELGSLFVTRPTLAHYVAERADLERRAAAVLGAVASGRLRIRIGARFPLEQVADAHRALEARATTGKLVLAP